MPSVKRGSKSAGVVPPAYVRQSRTALTNRPLLQTVFSSNAYGQTRRFFELLATFSIRADLRFNFKFSCRAISSRLRCRANILF